MPVDSMSDRPIFASEEVEFLTPGRPPISRLAIASLVLGIISSLVLFNVDLIVLPILAVALGLAAYFYVLRNDALSGRSLALLGLSMGLAFGLASLTSTRLRDQYLYSVSGEVAKHFVDVIAQNRLLEAFELTLTEGERQVAGTSIEEHYRLADEITKQRIDSFKSEDSVKRIARAGPQAKWEFVEGVTVIERYDQVVHITVRLADKSRTGGALAEVTLSRDYRAGAASWHVVSVK